VTVKIFDYVAFILYHNKKINASIRRLKMKIIVYFANFCLSTKPPFGGDVMLFAWRRGLPFIIIVDFNLSVI